MKVLVLAFGTRHCSYQIAPVAHELQRKGHEPLVVACSSQDIDIPGWEGPVSRIFWPDRDRALRRHWRSGTGALRFRRELDRFIDRERPDGAIVLDCEKPGYPATLLSLKDLPNVVFLQDCYQDDSLRPGLKFDAFTSTAFAAAFREIADTFLPSSTFYTGYPVGEHFRGIKAAAVPVRPTPFAPLVILVLDRKPEGALAPIVAKTLRKLQEARVAFVVHHFVLSETVYVEAIYGAEHVENVHVHPYEPDGKAYASYFAQAHVCIARAGAGDIFDCVAAQLPAVFISRRIPEYDYQVPNAQAAYNAKIGLNVEEEVLDTKILSAALFELTGNAKRRSAARRALRILSEQNAAAPSRICEILYRQVHDAQAAEAKRQRLAEEEIRKEDIRLLLRLPGARRLLKIPPDLSDPTPYYPFLRKVLRFHAILSALLFAALLFLVIRHTCRVGWNWLATVSLIALPIAIVILRTSAREIRRYASGR